MLKFLFICAAYALALAIIAAFPFVGIVLTVAFVAMVLKEDWERSP